MDATLSFSSQLILIPRRSSSTLLFASFALRPPRPDLCSRRCNDSPIACFSLCVFPNIEYLSRTSIFSVREVHNQFSKATCRPDDACTRNSSSNSSLLSPKCVSGHTVYSHFCLGAEILANGPNLAFPGGGLKTTKQHKSRVSGVERTVRGLLHVHPQPHPPEDEGGRDLTHGFRNRVRIAYAR